MKLRRVVAKPFRFAVRTALRVGPTRELLASVVAHMARTGLGTDECLKRGCLPVPVHFYQPIPDIADLERRRVWDRRSDLGGIDFRPGEQSALLKSIGTRFGGECDWPLHTTGNPLDYHTENPGFGYVCAAALHSVIRNFRPARVLEIGSGRSSLIINAALARNRTEDPARAQEYTVIDPFPNRDVLSKLPELTDIVTQRVECSDLSHFTALHENDILFIDSGHTVRIGGDVNFLILGVLPVLAPGVIVHFHDIALPYEYARVYATKSTFRMFWTEAYLLQAFLAFNTEFEILLAVGFLQLDRTDEFRAAFPHYDPAVHKAIGGSFWIRRKPRHAGSAASARNGAGDSR